MNEKDIYLARMASSGVFEESPLVVHPSQVVMTDSASNLVMRATVPSASYLSSSSDILSAGASVTLRGYIRACVPGSSSVWIPFYN